MVAVWLQVDLDADAGFGFRLRSRAWSDDARPAGRGLILSITAVMRHRDSRVNMR